jgi:magnesium chelatase subunit I
VAPSDFRKITDHDRVLKMTDIPHFPLSAVVGADDLKLALYLTAIDPKIGGVLIEGPRGMAKSTLARGLADLLASGQFVTLPLGATEERLVGTLDLDAALSEGRAQFSPGVLAKADGGVLYVDEVNLLPDHLVDLLLDVAASGTNLVERDGISHRHSARFVLIGTMNPEEGELRPQLLDRFGLNVALSGHTAPTERGQIIRRRLDFDSDPQAFCAQWEAEQQRCANAANRRASPWRALRWTTRLWRASPSAALPPASMACVPIWSGCAARAHAAWRGVGDCRARYRCGGGIRPAPSPSWVHFAQPSTICAEPDQHPGRTKRWAGAVGRHACSGAGDWRTPRSAELAKK